MTKDGKENRWGKFYFTDEQADRAMAGDTSVAWEFVQDNYTYLYRWARKFVRNRFWYMPRGYYEAEELVNQVYVDFPLYNLLTEKSLAISIWRSYMWVGCGGFARYDRNVHPRLSLDAPCGITSRSGDSEDGDTLGNLLPSREPTPYEVLAMKEHIQEIAPRFFAELGKVCGKNGGEPFRDIVEEVFFGLSFEEVKRYAKR